MGFFKQDYLDFFIELAGNNTKDWFDANRIRYEKFVKIPFSEFVQHVINSIAKQDSDFADLTAKECIFRINRDIRFSNDKTPYKLMSSAVVAVNGKKSHSINGIYFEFGPEHIRIYGGVYEIDKENLYKLREGICENLTEFKKLYNSEAFKSLFGDIQGLKNKIIPSEFKENANSEPLIFNKQFYFYTTYPAETLLDDDLDEILINAYRVGKPLEDFFNHFIHRT